MNSLERRAVVLLASIYALRMAGLFLILPVFALYATGLDGHTPLLIGIAIGFAGVVAVVLPSIHVGAGGVTAVTLLDSVIAVVAIAGDGAAGHDASEQQEDDE